AVGRLLLPPLKRYGPSTRTRLTVSPASPATQISRQLPPHGDQAKAQGPPGTGALLSALPVSISMRVTELPSSLADHRFTPSNSSATGLRPTGIRSRTLPS